jgi:hypothetical protein
MALDGGSGSGGSSGSAGSGGAGGDASTDGSAGTDGGVGGSAGSVGLTCADHDSDNADTTCANFATATCNFALTCEPAFLSYFKSKDDCIAIIKAQCVNELKLTGTGKTAGRVWAETQVLTSAKNCVPPVATYDATCNKQGTVAVGGACASDSQCNKGKCELTNYCGTCVAVPQLGDSCKQGDVCATGAYCDGSTCKTQGGLGDTCTDANQCKTGFFCQAGGTCAALGNAGASCAAQYECRTDLICSSDNKCVAVTFGKAGDTCNSLLGMSCELGTFCQKDGKCQAIQAGSACGGSDFLKCGAGQYCAVTDTDAGTSTCVALASAGETCSDTDGPACETFLSCINAKCAFADSTVCK